MPKQIPILRSFEDLKRDFESTRGMRKTDDQFQFQRDKIIFEAMISLNNTFQNFIEKMETLINEIQKKN